MFALARVIALEKFPFAVAELWTGTRRTRSAALACGLEFHSLASRRYDLVLRTEHLGLAAVDRLLNVLTSARFRRELEAVAGYDVRETGRRVV
jgi:molybdate-binding protein